MSTTNGAEVDISVVIPCRNSVDVLGDQLIALAKQDHPGGWEIVIADNGSNEGLHALVDEHQSSLPPIKVVDASGRAGINHARNVGVAHAEGQAVLCCDADDMVQPDWLAAHALALAGAALVGGPIDSLATATDFADEQPRGRLQRFGTLGFLPYPIGANCGFRRTVWEEVGGFDESWLYGADEVHFFWNAQLAGHEIAWVPDAVVDYRLKADRRSRVRKAYAVNVGDAHLYHAFRDRGYVHRSPLVGLVRRLGKLVLTGPAAAVHRGESLTRWRCELAALRGRLAGIIKYRVLHF